MIAGRACLSVYTRTEIVGFPWLNPAHTGKHTVKIFGTQNYIVLVKQPDDFVEFSLHQTDSLLITKTLVYRFQRTFAFEKIN
jgi:hypothetical protein